MSEYRARLERTTGLRMRVIAGSGAVFAVLLMITSSAAGANHTYGSPWGKGLVTPANVIVELSGCAKVVGKPATFSKKTGVALWDGNAAASTCKKGALGASQTSNALEQYATALTYPVSVPIGSHTTTFNVTWNITSTANYTLAYKGTCPTAVWNATLGFTYVECIAEAISQVINYAELVDLTTGVITSPSYSSGYGAFAYSYVENYSYCVSASGCYSSNSSVSTPWSSQSTSLNVNYNITTTTSSADKYAIYTYVGGDIVDEFEVYHGSATGAINMKTGGESARLVSIVVS